MGCFYCDEHHEGREAIMYKVGEMEAGVLYLFKDQAHKGRCALALKAHKKELCECTDQERADFAEDLAKASGAIKELWGCICHERCDRLWCHPGAGKCRYAGAGGCLSDRF